MAKWTFSTKWPTQALWKAHQAEKARARYHKREREGQPAAAQEVTSLSGELKQAKATIAEQLSDYRASSACLSAAATKAEGEAARDLKQQVRNVIPDLSWPNSHPLQTPSCLALVRPPGFSS
jgi:hypothetical protein